MTRAEQEKRRQDNIAKEEARILETKKLILLFLKTNFSDKQLSFLTGISDSTIQRRLTNKERILLAFPDKGEEIFSLVSAKRAKNKELGKMIGAQKSSKNRAETERISLEILGDDEVRRMKKVIHMALTFRAKLPVLAELFKISETELNERISLISQDSVEFSRGLKYLFSNSDNFNQEIAKANLVSWYWNFLDAKQKRNKDAIKRLMSEIDDSKLSELRSTRQSGESLSDEDIRIILNYQLKYALTMEVAANTAKVARSNYAERIERLMESDVLLRSQYECLEVYNSRKSGGRR